MCGLWLLAETRIKRYTENSQQTGVLTKPNDRKKERKKALVRGDISKRVGKQQSAPVNRAYAGQAYCAVHISGK